MNISNITIGVLRTSTVLATLLLLNGCASMAGSHTDSVSVSTPACPEAQCVLENDDGKYYIKETPGTVVVERAYGDLVVTCRKGNKIEVVSVPSKADGVWGNILLGGIIGWGVDAATGAGYSYPKEVINPLECAKEDQSTKRLKSKKPKSEP